MDYKIRTTANHYGIELQETWHFPKPTDVQRGDDKEATLRITEDKKLGAETVYETTVPLTEVPPRAADKYREGAGRMVEKLEEMIHEAGRDKTEEPGWVREVERESE
jgi:hypothetical protein